MTREELVGIKRRLDIAPSGVLFEKDAMSLIAAVEEQQKEIDHRDQIIHDLTEESTAYRLGVQEGRGEFFDLLHAEPLWATSEIPEQILEKCQHLYDDMIPPSRHQQECERLLIENEDLRKKLEELTQPPTTFAANS